MAYRLPNTYLGTLYRIAYRLTAVHSLQSGNHPLRTQIRKPRLLMKMLNKSTINMHENYLISPLEVRWPHKTPNQNYGISMGKSQRQHPTDATSLKPKVDVSWSGTVFFSASKFLYVTVSGKTHHIDYSMKN